MASSTCLKAWVLATVALALCFQATLGNKITCENLDKDSCGLAVSSSGKRCVLEQRIYRSGKEAYVCHTSEIEAEKLSNYIETAECIAACGVDRHALGISSDSLLDAHFIQKLCSPQCYNSCTNILDLYFNLAAGEGVYLPKLCEDSRGGSSRREMAEMKSSGNAAAGPVSGGSKSFNFMMAPAMAPY